MPERGTIEYERPKTRRTSAVSAVALMISLVPMIGYVLNRVARFLGHHNLIWDLLGGHPGSILTAFWVSGAALSIAAIIHDRRLRGPGAYAGIISLLTLLAWLLNPSQIDVRV